MKNKGRKSKQIDDSSQFLLHVPKTIKEKCKNEDIIKILIQFESSTNIEDQTNNIRQLSTFLPTDDFIISLFSNLFVTASPKNPVKKSILRIFATSSDFIPKISLEISIELQKLLKNTNNNQFDLLNNCINSLNDCFNNCPPGLEAINLILVDVVEFLVNCFKIFVGELSNTSPIYLQNLYDIIHRTSRCFVSITHQCNIDTIIINYTEDIISLSKTILNHPEILYDTKNNCGIVLVTTLKYSYGNCFFYLFDICVRENTEKWGLSHDDLKDDLVTTCVCSGILNVINQDNLCEYYEKYDIRIMTIICTKLLNIAESSADNPGIVLAVNRTFLVVSRTIKLLSEEAQYNFFNSNFSVLIHVMAALEHNIDTVRHLARSILINLVKVEFQRFKIGNSIQLSQILRCVTSLPVNRHSRYTALSAIANEIGCTYLLSRYDGNLASQLLELISDSSTSIYISQKASSCYETLMRVNISEVNDMLWLRTWVIPLTRQLEMGIVYRDDTRIQNLLMVAIKLKPSILDFILNQWSYDSERSLCTLLKCALIARKIGATLVDQENKWRGLIDFEGLENAMCHQNEELRIASLALIAECHKTTEIFTEIELNFIVKFLHYNINTQYPSMRQQILALIKKIITRFGESYHLIVRNFNKFSDKPELANKYVEFQTQKQYYEKFCFHLRDCIFESLFPGANFSRRIICLEVLTLMDPVLNEIKTELKLEGIWKKSDADAVLLCLTDSYESNKKLAISLLEKCPIELLELNDLENTHNYLNASLKMAQSVKPADSITAAYMLDICILSPVLKNVLCSQLMIELSDHSKEYLMIELLLKLLQSQVAVAKENLLKAAAHAPMHGTLFCIRHLIEKYLYVPNFDDTIWKPLINSIIKTSFEINHIVGPVVNNSSPEGHLPMDQDATDDEDQTITSQMLLVCSWRCVKEVSLLLGDLTLKSTISTNGLIQEDLVLKIGEHFTVLLTETKHRGAFEQAYVGFSKLCTRLWKCSSEKLHQLPVIWLNDILNALSGRGHQNTKLCATRRSAGVPFMIQAIVASEIETGSTTHFNQCISTLIQYANTRGDNIEMRTHSMNILRALYRHTQLGELVTPFIADGIMIAVIGFGRRSWAERNSATLLFASLMTRIFGVQRTKENQEISIQNKMTSSVFFMRYPGLYPFLIKHLDELSKDENCSSCKELSVYPIFLLLARLYRSVQEQTQPSTQLEQFLPYVEKFLGNKSLKIRELAAKAIVPLIPTESHKKTIKELFDSLVLKHWDKNYLHGILLEIYNLLQFSDCFERNQDIFEILKGSLWILDYDNENLISAELYLQIILLLIRRRKLRIELWQHVYEFLSRQTFTNPNYIIGRTIYQKTSVQLQIQLLEKLEIADGAFIIKRLKDDDYLGKEYILHFLIHTLNHKHSSVLLDKFEFSDGGVLTLSDRFIRDLHVELCKDAFFEVLRTFLNDDKLGGKALMVLSYFPNRMMEIGKEYSENVVDYYTERVYSANEEVTVAALTCISQLFLFYTYHFTHKIDLTEICNILYEFSGINNNVCCRLCIAVIMVENQFCILHEQNKSIENTCLGWKVVMQLLDDSEPLVRFTINHLVSQSIIAEKCREDVLNLFTSLMIKRSRETCISMLIFWALAERDIVDLDDDNEGQIFEKGETSIYVENMCLSLLSAKQLKTVISCSEIVDIPKVFNEIVTILNNDNETWKMNMHEKCTFTNILTELAEMCTNNPNCEDTLNDYFRVISYNNMKYKMMKILQNLLPESIELK